MNVTIDRQGEVTVFRLDGRLDGTTANTLEHDYLAKLEEGATRFAFDLGQLEYVSSAGLRVLLLAAKKTRAAGGRIALFRLNTSVKEVFEISGFRSIFAVFETGDEAVSFAAAP